MKEKGRKELKDERDGRKRRKSRQSRLSRSSRLSYVWDRCRFENTVLRKMDGGAVDATGCAFAGCRLFDIGGSKIRMTDCALDGSCVEGNWWERPADVLLRG